MRLGKLAAFTSLTSHFNNLYFETRKEASVQIFSLDESRWDYHIPVNARLRRATLTKKSLVICLWKWYSLYYIKKWRTGKRWSKIKYISVDYFASYPSYFSRLWLFTGNRNMSFVYIIMSKIHSYEIKRITFFYMYMIFFLYCIDI